MLLQYEFYDSEKDDYIDFEYEVDVYSDLPLDKAIEVFMDDNGYDSDSYDMLNDLINNNFINEDDIYDYIDNYCDENSELLDYFESDAEEAFDESLKD